MTEHMLNKLIEEKLKILNRMTHIHKNICEVLILILHMYVNIKLWDGGYKKLGVHISYIFL